MRLNHLYACIVTICALALAGCDSLTCGIGTHEESGQCVPNVLIECGDGTRYANGWCVVEDVSESGDADNISGADARMEVR